MLKFKKLSQILCVTFLLVSFAGCKSAKKTEDQQQVTQEAPAPTPAPIDNTAMNFDAQGSDSGRVDGLVTVNFDYDKSTLSAEAKKKLQGNVKWMKANAQTKVQIEGHCDARGTIEYNLALGERRAKAVRDYLSHSGVPTSRLSIISYGKEKMISPGDSEADNAKNRRANFLPLAK